MDGSKARPSFKDRWTVSLARLSPLLIFPLDDAHEREKTLEFLVAHQIVSEGTIDRDAVWVYLMTQVEISVMCVPIMEFCSSLFNAAIFTLFFQTNVLYVHIIFTLRQVITSY